MERIWEYYCIYRTGNLNWYGSYLYRSLCIVAEGIPHERAVNHCFCHHHVFRRRYHSDIFAAEAASHAEYCMVNCIAGAFNVWLAIVGRTFIQSSIPEELFEATCLDGGDYFQYLTRVVLPLAKPILAVLALNFALTHWNSYYSALLYLNESVKFPLQLVLRNILLNNQVDITQMSSDALDMMNKQYLSELLKYSLIIISSVPLMITYPFLQKYFIKGAMVGSVKG